MPKLEAQYDAIIDKLKLGQRPMIHYSPSEMEEILVWGCTANNDKNVEHLKKCLCLLEHTRSPSSQCTDFLVTLLEAKISDEILIYALGTSAKHIIGYYSLQGEKTPIRFREALLLLLKNKNPEVLEWVLRIIEQLGSQTLMFIDPVAAIKPSAWKALPPPLGNQHAKNCRDIIKLLEKRWRIFK